MGVAPLFMGGWVMQILEADESGLLVRLSRDASVHIAGGLLLAAMVRQ